jgi:hypothetical protein
VTPSTARCAWPEPPADRIKCVLSSCSSESPSTAGRGSCVGCTAWRAPSDYGSSAQQDRDQLAGLLRIQGGVGEAPPRHLEGGQIIGATEMHLDSRQLDADDDSP